MTLLETRRIHCLADWDRDNYHGPCLKQWNSFVLLLNGDVFLVVLRRFFSMFFHMFSASMNSMDRNSTGMATLAPAPAPAKACWAQPQGGAKTHGATDGEALRQLGGC